MLSRRELLALSGGLTIAGTGVTAAGARKISTSQQRSSDAIITVEQSLHISDISPAPESTADASITRISDDNQKFQLAAELNNGDTAATDVVVRNHSSDPATTRIVVMTPEPLNSNISVKKQTSEKTVVNIDLTLPDTASPGQYDTTIQFKPLSNDREEKSEAQQRNADIHFLIDTSGSMGNEINSVKNGVTGFADTIRSDSDTGDIKLSVTQFGEGGGVADAPVVENLTGDVEEVKREVNNLGASGGFEEGFFAVDKAIDPDVKPDQRNDADQIQIMLTDENSADSSKVNPNDVMNEVEEQAAKFIAISAGKEPKTQAQRISNGVHSPISEFDAKTLETEIATEVTEAITPAARAVQTAQDAAVLTVPSN